MPPTKEIRALVFTQWGEKGYKDVCCATAKATGWDRPGTWTISGLWTQNLS